MDMSVEITHYFREFVSSFDKNKKPKKETIQKSSNNNNIISSTDFKTQSVKLLESIFSLRQILEAIHEEYVSLVPRSESDVGSKCYQMEINSGRMMQLCQECLINVKSNKYVNSDVPSDVRLHRSSVGEMLDIYLKGCQRLNDEITRMKRKRGLVRNQPTVTDSLLYEQHLGGSTLTGEENKNENGTQVQQLRSRQAGVYERLMRAEVEEKQQLQRQLADLGRMNEQLAENVTEQHQLLDRIETATVHAGLDIDLGNQQLSSAMQNQSNTRFWLLFIFIVLSFSLIFIDWYNT